MSEFNAMRRLIEFQHLIGPHEETVADRPMTPPSPTEQATLDRIEAAEPAPESFDAVAALRRVMALADELDLVPINHAETRRTVRHTADLIRRAIDGTR